VTTAAKLDNSCLHLVLGSGAEALDACSSCCGLADAVLFMDAGVLHVLDDNLHSFTGGRQSVYFSTADLQAHGLLKVALDAGLAVAEDSLFTRLLREHDHCLSWT